MVFGVFVVVVFVWVVFVCEVLWMLWLVGCDWLVLRWLVLKLVSVVWRIVLGEIFVVWGF